MFGLRTRAFLAAAPLALLLLPFVGQADAQEPPTEPAQEVQQRSLRFNFRFQLWSDVLEWFAEEAGLSLVIPNPPPGTFNYSDTRAYTPEEAIDILNGVLLTQGFTLIRRDRMLVLHDLSQGIPAGLVPHVEWKDLDRRGRFELVTVRFALGRKPVQVVQSEITPLLGPHGKVVALPTTRQLLVTDTAGAMQGIKAVIDAVPEPERPKQEPKKEERKERPPSPRLAVYPLTKADPQTARDVLRRMIPNATFEYDQKRGQLYAYATPESQATIAVVLDNMEADLPAGLHRYLEVYSVKEAGATPPGSTAGTVDEASRIIRDSFGTPRYRTDEYGRYPRGAGESVADSPAGAAVTDTFLATLQRMVPGAGLHMDRQNSRLVAFATEAEHEIIKSVIEKLGGTATDDEVPHVDVYAITHPQPDSLKAMFESLFPGVQIRIDKPTGQMAIRGYPSEHAAIESTLERLMPPLAEGEEPAAAAELRWYPLKDRYTRTLRGVLAELVPGALVTLDYENGRLIVSGSASDHEIIGRAMEQLEAAQAAARSKLVVYRVTPVQKSRLATVLRSLLREMPGVVVLPDVKATELAVWATALQHEVIGEIVQQFQGEGEAAEDDQLQLVAYPLRSTDPRRVEELLTDLFPGARMLADRGGSRLLVWAAAADHERIKTSIAGVTADLPPDEQPRFEAYAIDGRVTRSATSARAFESQLKELVPRARLTLDSATGELIVWGSPEDQARVRTSVEKLGQGDAPGNKPAVKIYPLGDLDPVMVQTLLGQRVRDAQLSVDAKSENLVAVAVPADQDVIQKTLDELQRSDFPELTPELRVHNLEEALPANVLKLLGDLAPRATISVDSDSERLMVLATPADHEKILETIAKVKDIGSTTPEVRFYPLENKLPEAILRVLESLTPKARITPDATGKYLTVLATQADHEVVKKTIAEASATLPPEEKVRLAVYPVTSAQHHRFQSILRSLAAELPGVEVLSDATPGQLSIWAKPSEHQVLAGLLDELRRELPPEEQFQLRVHPLHSADPARTIQVLEELFPNTRLTLDARSNRLMVWTRAAEHAAIESALGQIDRKAPAEDQRRFEVYTLGTIGASPASRAARSSAMLTGLQTLVPTARLTIDSQTGDLVALATPAEHTILRSAVERLDDPAGR